MIVWQGLGLLAALIPIAGYVLMVKLVQASLGLDYTNTHSWPGALGTLLGAVAVWFLAQRLMGPGRTMVDQQTGQTVVLRKKHTLFFIPMHYFAAILAVVALGMLLFKSGSPL